MPPNHYRLLGIEPFESDADVISSAADQRMLHLRGFQAGSHSAESQKLLNEVAAAKVCLLNAGKKASYDAGLRAGMAVGATNIAPAARESRQAEQFADFADLTHSQVVLNRRSVKERPSKPVGLIAVLLLGLMVVGALAAVSLRSGGGNENERIVVAVEPEKPKMPAQQLRQQAKAEQAVVAPKPPELQPVVLTQPTEANKPRQPQPIETVDPEESVAAGRPAEISKLTETSDGGEPPQAASEIEPSAKKIQPKQLLSEEYKDQPSIEIDEVRRIEWDKPVDILRLVIPARHSVFGGWVRRGKEIGSANAALFSRITVPYSPNGSYELSCEFTRSGRIAGFVLPVGERCFLFPIEPDGGGRDLLPGGRRVNDGRHLVVVTVLINSESKTADIAVTLHGRPFTKWNGPLEDVTIDPAWALSQPAQIGLIAGEGSVIYHSLKIREPKSEQRTADRDEPSRTAREIETQTDSFQSTDLVDDEKEVEWDKPVDILRRVNCDRDSVFGGWGRRGKEIGSANAALFSRISVPYSPNGSYEVSCEFTRSGRIAGFVLPVGEGCFLFPIEPDGGGRDLLPAGGRVNDGRHAVVVKVLIDSKSKSAEIEVTLDGRPYTKWNGPLEDVTIDPAWALPQPAQIGLIAGEGSVIYHSLKIREPKLKQRTADPLNDNHSEPGSGENPTAAVAPEARSQK
jgi:hypothetical protein